MRSVVVAPGVTSELLISEAAAATVQKTSPAVLFFLSIGIYSNTVTRACTKL